MHLLSALGAFSTLPQGLLLGFPALFSITDPIGNSVIFSQLTADRNQSERRAIAIRVGLYSAIFLLAALWAGSPALHFFGVTLPALKIGGGLVVAANGWRLLFTEEEAPSGSQSDVRQTAPEQRSSAADFAFFPITMPLVVGPGAISVAITLGAAPPPGLHGAYLAGVSLSALIVCGIVTVLFREAEWIGRALGPAGSRAVKRLVALLLLSIGVQIMALGLQAILIPFLQTAIHATQ
jgi:multiple antibiotic resistance protein